MSQISHDLRQRILNYVINDKGSIRKTAKLFSVSPDTVYRLKKLFYETGDILPRSRQYESACFVSEEGELFLKSLIVDDPDLRLADLCEKYHRAYGITVAISTMHGTLKRIGLSYKKKRSAIRSETAKRIDGNRSILMRP
jgi:transposase